MPLLCALKNLQAQFPGERNAFASFKLCGRALKDGLECGV